MGEAPSNTTRGGRRYYVKRAKVEQVYRRTRPDIAFLIAPGGYGKTVLASQLSELERCESAWASFAGCSPSAADLPSAAASALSVSTPMASATSITQAVIAESGWDRLAEALAGLGKRTSVIVMDGLGVLPSAAFARDLLLLCRRVIRPDIRLIITARDIQGIEDSNTFDVSTWVVDRTILEFDVEQVQELGAHILERQLDRAESTAVLSYAGSQPALVMLLLRNMALSGSEVSEVLRREPRDVLGYLEAFLADCVRCDARRLLGVAAMLRCGSVTQLVDAAEVDIEAMTWVAQSVPLMTVYGEPTSSARFVMHDLACDVFQRALLRDGSISRETVQAVARELWGRGDLEQLCQVIILFGDPVIIMEWLERLGVLLIEDARLDLLESVLEAIPAVTKAGSARVLLLSALLQRSRGNLMEALGLAAAARRAAELAGDEAAMGDCLLVEVRLHWDTADYSSILPDMVRGMERASARHDTNAQAFLCGYLASAYAQLGDVEAGIRYAVRFRSVSRQSGVLAATKAQALQPVLFVLGLVAGDIALAVRMLREAKSSSRYPRALSLQCDANLASLLVEMGRTKCAARTIERVQAVLGEAGLTIMSDSCAGTEGMICAALDETDRAERFMSLAIEQAVCQDDRFSIEYNRLYRSTIRRAAGAIDEALADSEDSLAALSESENELPIMRCLAFVELAANHLYLGNGHRARSLAEEAHDEALHWTAAYHLLRADMVLAEIDRIEGDFSAAVERLAAHRDYVASESANWQIAMYLRAFPGLLGVFVKALGTETLPSHLIRMVQRDYARRALDASAADLSGPEFQRMCVRLLGKRGAAAYLRERAAVPKATVRLFGGMEVTTPSGPVSDKDWRKRKARLLFALLVIKRGHEVPREQVYDHFWPDMDAERAKSNFYVTWSMLKRALAGGGKRADACPYVEHVGGVCKLIPGAVASDYADFEDALNAMRKADRVGDASLTLASAERIAEIYRGELLPGEMYDEWLAPIRDRCRHDFGDAMLRASQLCDDAGETEKALHMVRAALAQDPWREDLYQSALRYLIQSGQRSGAIETYVACKSKLAEDLGLDPSTETQRLYDQILAMEEPPQAPKK